MQWTRLVYLLFDVAQCVDARTRELGALRTALGVGETKLYSRANGVLRARLR